MIPASLIETSAEALFESLKYVYAHPREQVGELDREAARIVLEAAFAALPEVEEVVMEVAERMPHGWCDDDGVSHDEVSKGDYDRSKAYLIALSRMAQL